MMRTVSSPYIEWAKLESRARFTLAASGLPSLSLDELGASLDDVEIASPGGYGFAPLTECIAARYVVPRECVVTAAGTSMANHLAMAALIDPGDEVLIEWPTYEPLLGVASFHGAVVRRVDRRVGQDFGLDPDAVARALTPRTRLVVLANLHNPSSHYTDAAALERIGVLAARAGARVLVDEVYLDAVFDQTVRSAFHLGPTFVVTSSLTKVYGLSGLRCGWILAEPSLARRIWRLNDLFGNVDAHPAERLSVVAFRRLPALLARAQARLDTNRAIIGRFLESRDDLDGGVPLYGTTACLRPRAGRVDALCRVLRERYDVTVVPGSFFELPHYIRVGICGDAETLAEGLSRLGQALDELAATNTGST